ncbi:hypothetical protein AB0D10_09415 [Kitasatospora sp. NPDC048545]|uniref:hypothetical protein n=1 Tax=unclassified Kitasatospora TaxID=2633591 RepID=UPI0033F0B627
MTLLASWGSLAAQHSPSDDTTFAILNVAFIVLITAIVLVSQFSVRDVRAQTFLWVAMLVLRGFLPPGPAEATTTSIVFLVVGLAFSLVFGYYRGLTMPMWRDQTGRLLRKGGRTTAKLWVANLAERLIVGGVEVVFFHGRFNGNGVWLGVGVTLAVQQAVMMRRAPGITEVRPTGPGYTMPAAEGSDARAN